MRCIEIPTYSLFCQHWCVININMRCIEIMLRNLETGYMNLININMRCIEIKRNKKGQIFEHRLTLT